MIDATIPARLVLIRHGQSVDNVAGRISGWTDSDLTPIGVEQAARAARYVAATYELRAIYASPLRRAYETARALAQLTGHEIVVRHDLRELHFGDVEGLSEIEMRERFGEHALRAIDEDDETFAWPNGETRSDFYRRTRDVLHEIAGRHPGDTIAVVSHGGVISALVAELVDGKPSAWRRHLVANCSVTEIHFDGARPIIVQKNLTSHLE